MCFCCVISNIEQFSIPRPVTGTRLCFSIHVSGCLRWSLFDKYHERSLQAKIKLLLIYGKKRVLRVCYEERPRLCRGARLQLATGTA